MHRKASARTINTCRAPLMSLATTCDLGKGKFSVLIWQPTSLPPPQMGRGTARGQLLGVTATEREGQRGEPVQEEFKVFLYASACLCANACKPAASLWYFSLLVPLCAPLCRTKRATCSASKTASAGARVLGWREVRGEIR